MTERTGSGKRRKLGKECKEANGKGGERIDQIKEWTFLYKKEEKKGRQRWTQQLVGRMSEVKAPEFGLA